MEKSFEDYFNERIIEIERFLFSGTRSDIYDLNRLNFSPIITTISGAINAFEKSQSGADNINIRSDAKFFLMLNFDQMVFRPLSISNPGYSINDRIYDDIFAILTRARQDALASRSNEISGHAIVNAIALSWGSLKTLSSDSW